MALAVLPAAGVSRRMGRPKLTLPFGDSTVVGSLVAALRAGGLGSQGRIVLVHAPEDRSLAAWGKGEGIILAANPDPSRGMLSSLWAGLEALGGCRHLAEAGEILLVSPADLPALRPETVKRVLETMKNRRPALALPVHRGHRGHPLAIAPRLIPEIETLDLEIGLRQLVERYRRHRGEVLEVEIDDPGAVQDVDTPEDYRRLRPASS